MSYKGTTTLKSDFGLRTSLALHEYGKIKTNTEKKERELPLAKPKRTDTRMLIAFFFILFFSL